MHVKEPRIPLKNKLERKVRLASKKPLTIGRKLRRELMLVLKVLFTLAFCKVCSNLLFSIQMPNDRSKLKQTVEHYADKAASNVRSAAVNAKNTVVYKSGKAERYLTAKKDEHCKQS
jgi:hypothetical protein